LTPRSKKEKGVWGGGEGRAKKWKGYLGIMGWAVKKLTREAITQGLEKNLCLVGRQKKKNKKLAGGEA